MINFDLETVIRNQIAGEVKFRTAGSSKLKVSLPLTFGDGDACEVAVREIDEGKWVLSDLGHVVSLGRMQDVSLLSAGYVDKFHRMAAYYGAQEIEGELQVHTETEGLGDAIFTLSQACLELARMIDEPPETTRKPKPFHKKFSRTIEKSLSHSRLLKNWFDSNLDPLGIYKSDYMYQGKHEKWVIFGVASSAKCWRAASSVQHYRLKKSPVRTLFTYKDSLGSDSTLVAAMKDNADRMFSLDEEHGDLKKFLREVVKP